MKYLDWLKTNPEKGYYWVKYQDCDEERIDEFTDWYDNAGNKETRFTDQPDEVISDRLTYDEYMMTKECLKMLFEAAQRETILKELLKECREHLKYIVICPQNKKIIEKLDQALGEE